MRVRKVVTCVHPVGIHGAEILSMQLDKRAGQLGTEPETLGEIVGLELELARQDVKKQLDDSIHGGQSVRKQDEANDDGVLSVEAECIIERSVIDENGEQGEDIEEMSLSVVSVSKAMQQMLIKERDRGLRT